MPHVDWENLLLGGLISVLISLIVLTCYLGSKAEHEWQEFKATHECKIVGQKEGQTSTGFAATASGNGAIVTTTTPGQTGWLCSDGITYWRD